MSVEVSSNLPVITSGEIVSVATATDLDANLPLASIRFVIDEDKVYIKLSSGWVVWGP